MERAFTMPQFVTSVAGYGGSARAKQVGLFGRFWLFFGCLMRVKKMLDCRETRGEKRKIFAAVVFRTPAQKPKTACVCVGHGGRFCRRGLNKVFSIDDEVFGTPNKQARCYGTREV